MEIVKNLTIKDLIEILKTYPENMPVASNYEASRIRSDHKIETELFIGKVEWEDTNYPYDEKPFEYLNIGY